jgi:DNA-binding GntR family transcriptional regulator
MARTGSSNRSDTAYERLRADIIAGRWLPGTILSTYGLAEELEMSRTPIIGALKRLEVDGLIEIIPQVGCRVLRRAHEEISETFMIRAALEALGAERAATRITDRELAALEEALRAGENAAATGDADGYEQANQAFHTQILAASRLTQMQRILNGLWTLNRYQLATSRFLSTRMSVSAAEHRTIFEALKARDPERARQAVDDHLRSCSGDYLAFVQARTEAGAPLDEVPAPDEVASAS